MQIWEATRGPHLLEKQGYISPLPPTPAPPQDPKAQLCGPDLGDAKARGRSLWLGPAVQLWGCDSGGGGGFPSTGPSMKLFCSSSLKTIREGD